MHETTTQVQGQVSGTVPGPGSINPSVSGSVENEYSTSAEIAQQYEKLGVDIVPRFLPIYRESVLARAKFAFPVDAIAALLAMFRRPGELMVLNASTAVSIDPGDTKFPHRAETAQADNLPLATSATSRKRGMT